MLSIRQHMRRRRPPSPFVEDEIVSLSRELHGLSHLGEKPGVEGARARGSVDQFPILLTLDALSLPPLSHSTENTSSDDSSGPPTPPSEARTDPVLRSLGDTLSLPKSSVDSAKFHSPSKQNFRKTSSSSRRSSQQPDPYQASSVTMKQNSPAGPKSTGSQKPARDALRNSPASSSDASFLDGSLSNTTRHSMLNRSGSTKHSRSTAMESTRQRSSSTSSHRPASDTAKPKVSQAVPPRGKQKPLTLSTKIPPPAPEVDELSECQHELRGPATSLRKGHNRKAASAPTSPNCVIRHSFGAKDYATMQAVRSPQSLAGSPPKSLTTSADSPNDNSDDDSDASFCTAPLPTSRPKLSRPASEEATQTKGTIPSRGKSPQKNTTPDRETESEQALVRLSRESSPSQRTMSPAPSRNPGLRLLPCPRSVPVAGHQDWRSISGLTHLNICPLCAKQIVNSGFRDYLAPAIPKSRNQKIHCSFSEPWTRLAWIQTLKKGLDNLSMLDQVTRPFPASAPCPGRTVDDQYWYRVVDTGTGMYLPKFNVCSTCARNLKILMPSLRETFKRSTSKQERVCDFATECPRFVQYIDFLDIAANRADVKGSAHPDISEFLTYARRKLLFRNCRRNRQIFSTWHYMPDLPELTVCEDCYDDVVYPLARASNPIACRFNSSLRLLPGKDRASRCREASCQLYSPRMRAKFHKAAGKNDLPYLEFVALRRTDAEQRYHDREEELLEDEEMGYDCDSEMQENMEEWRRWE